MNLRRVIAVGVSPLLEISWQNESVSPDSVVRKSPSVEQ